MLSTKTGDKDIFGKRHSNGIKTYTTGWDYLFSKFLERWAGPRPGSRDSLRVSIYGSEDKRTQQRRMRRSSQWERIRSEDNDKQMKIFLQKIIQALELLGIEFWWCCQISLQNDSIVYNIAKNLWDGLLFLRCYCISWICLTFLFSKSNTYLTILLSGGMCKPLS